MALLPRLWNRNSSRRAAVSRASRAAAIMFVCSIVAIQWLVYRSYSINIQFYKPLQWTSNNVESNMDAEPIRNSTWKLSDQSFRGDDLTQLRKQSKRKHNIIKSFKDPSSRQSFSDFRTGTSSKPTNSHPVQRHTGGFSKRYANSPFVEGYRPTGGALPMEHADFLQSERMWKYVSNTCLQVEQNETIPEWQFRAPYVILLGAMKCGTHALTESLWEHPMVARNGHWELHFFDSDKPVRNEQGIDSVETRRLYMQAFRKASPEFFMRSVNEQHQDAASIPNNNNNMITMESSPRYLLSSDRLPHLILCVVPWVKFLVLVRDPIARAGSQYRYLDEARRADGEPMVDWPNWVGDDLRRLEEAGVLTAASRDEERAAWRNYQRRPNSNMIVGRGLYILQLLDYFEAMDFYKKPRSDMMVLRSERFRRQRQEEYDQVLKFLGLSPHTLVNAKEEIHGTKHNESVPLPESIKLQLQELYKPYNQRLYDLLGWSSDMHWD